MAKEIRVTSGLTIYKRGTTDTSLVLQQYQAQPSSFSADMDGTKGPIPGSFSVGIGGKIVDLSELGTPGVCRISNMDETNYVTVGIWDPGIDVYYPMLELLPGESYVMRLYRHIQEEYTGTGTGTTGPGNYLFMKADTDTVAVKVEAFEA
jgi:hypothetical protein